ncbi:Glycoside hydrolase family 16 [Dillenia turbinata]|uniref:Xyloglucan endotransglucosylase/hydrolase n=1 Tax=Dillenia turbinata TaxID=194707 RepID=A0AAN8VP51_9MAGN
MVGVLSQGLFAFLLLGGVLADARREVGFGTNYVVSWGKEHFRSLDEGREVQLLMDKTSGAGFASKLNYRSGFFAMKIKIPGRDTAGVVTAFYLTTGNRIEHEELDFEFLGNVEGQPIILQTNVFANGIGNREHRVRLWFDPSEDFHTYQILWNAYQIVLYKNQRSKKVSYPTKPMRIEGTLWDGEDRATDGGRKKTNWAFAPFKANFQGFNIDGCSSTARDCRSPKYWWNTRKYRRLDAHQQQAYENTRKHVVYDYCTDRKRYPMPPPECPHRHD